MFAMHPASLALESVSLDAFPETRGATLVQMEGAPNIFLVVRSFRESSGRARTSSLRKAARMWGVAFLGDADWQQKNRQLVVVAQEAEANAYVVAMRWVIWRRFDATVSELRCCRRLDLNGRELCAVTSLLREASGPNRQGVRMAVRVLALRIVPR